ncbi:Flp pilus assembly complex ATPase component TadA [Patescibacteria group bacterium]|nr:Flp pilus assembly complex ATPase component TadA [Patescibacteria group bacterium]
MMVVILFSGIFAIIKKIFELFYIMPNANNNDTADREEKLQKKISQIDRREKEQEAMRIAASVELPYINLEKVPVERKAVALIPEKIALETGAVAFARIDKDDSKIAKVGLFVPEDESVIEIIEESLDKNDYKPDYYVISENSLRKCLDVYATIIKVEEKKEKLEVKEEELVEAQAEIKNLSNLADKLVKVPVSEVLEIILAGALMGEASDIHLEPEEGNVKLRYRIDGVLADMATISKEAYKKVVSRIKLEAGLKLNIVDKPQDGRFTVAMKDKEVDIRTSILPTAYGETIVLRLLGVGAISLKIEDIGIRDQALEILKKAIKKPNG